MTGSLNKLIGFKVKTKDGMEGTIKDFLFDQVMWHIRYAEVKIGNLFSSRRIIVPGEKFNAPDWDQKTFFLAMTQKELENCPPLEADLPISRRYEEKLNKHLNLTNYWDRFYVPPGGAPAATYPVSIPQRPIPEKAVKEDNIESSLRSFKEVCGYKVNTMDGELGHIEDLITDKNIRNLPFLVVDTHDWIPWSRKVMIRRKWVEKFSYRNQEASLLLTTKMVEAAPEYSDSIPIHEVYGDNSQPIRSEFVVS